MILFTRILTDRQYNLQRCYCMVASHIHRGSVFDVFVPVKCRGTVDLVRLLYQNPRSPLCIHETHRTNIEIHFEIEVKIHC